MEPMDCIVSLAPTKTLNRHPSKTPPSPKEESLVIVGGGMACHRLCQRLIQEGYASHRISVYSGETSPPYDRANLSKYFHQSLKEPPLLSHRKWYEKHGITLHLSKRVEHLDAKNKRLRFEDGSTRTYHKLVLATGKRPDVPNIEGTHLDSVFTYRNWQDLLKIESFCRPGRKVAIVGGGLLGLEAADALHRAHCQVTIYEMANTLLCRNLSETAGAVLLEAMEARGITVCLRSQLEHIATQHGKLSLVFRGDTSSEVDGVLLATGAHPSDELAVDSGIQVSPKGGFLVNETLTTNHPDVYALGDCASIRHETFGFVQPAYEQADVLAARLCGKGPIYTPKGLNCRLNVLGIEVSAYGENLGEGEHLVYSENGTFRSLVLLRGKLIGATAIGPWDQATALGVAVQENLRIPHRQKKHFCESGHLELLANMGSVTTWPAEAVVCNCTHMSCQAIKNAIAEGYHSLGELEEHTQAGGQCGSCRPLLLGLIHPHTNHGAPGSPIYVHSSKHLLWIACIGLVSCLIFWAPGQVPEAESVQTWHYTLSQIWNHFTTKQITGYATAGLSLGSLLLSLRKRVKWLKWGEFTFWRTLHTSLGSLTLLTLFFHTGLSLGHNLNFWLASCFLGLNTLGALAAIAAASQDKAPHPTKNVFRVWMMRLHLLFFWPYPVLLGIHIYKVYQY